MGEFRSAVGVREGVNKVELNSAFNHISGFALLNLRHSREYCFKSGDSETGLLILEGSCDISIDGKAYPRLGRRESVFSGTPAAVYIPISCDFSIKSEQALVAMCTARCCLKSVPAVIYPEDVKIIKAGKDNWSRDVRLIIGPDSPAVNLILGETLNPPGNWSGIPPARHERDTLPEESMHEELYYFKTDKPQGWGIERIYSPERNINELIFLEENTVTFMPWGYHQIASAPGYMLYYLFFLAGKGKKLAQFEDPEHNWIK